MDRTSWKPKVYKATENVDYKANENWKDVADKFYKEELNKDKKSAGEAYFVEWGYDLDYDFAEIDDIDEAKQKAEAEGGNVYLNDQLVYSVIPSIKKDPTNDKSKFIVSNNLMGVESEASELKTYNNYNGKLNQEAQDVLRQWVSTLNHSSEVDFYNIPQDVLDTVNKYTSDWMEVETFIETISYYEEDVRGMESKSDKCSYCGKGRMKENPEQCSGCGDVFSSEAKASEYGDAIHSEDGNGWDQGGFFFGIPNMTRDDYEGTVYWKGKPVEHYDHDYFGGDGFEQDMEHDARELAEKCKDLESRGITPTTSSILSGESKASEAQIPCKECGGKGVTNWLGEDEMRCSVCAGTGVIDSEWEDNMDNEEHVYDAPIYIGTNKSWNESKATEISTIDRLRSWDKSEWNQKDINYGYTDAEWNQMSHEEQNRIVDKYEYENEDMWSNMSDQEKNSYESKEGFNQGLYGYVDAKCKTCGIEFDSIPDMDDHYAMNSDHISNLDDLDSDIPNSD